jgi:hypothetical protein
MDKEQKPPEPQTEPAAQNEEAPPPFKPDPRLVTYLERGRKDDAPERFKKALDDLEKRSQ